MAFMRLIAIKYFNRLTALIKTQRRLQNRGLSAVNQCRAGRQRERESIGFQLTGFQLTAFQRESYVFIHVQFCLWLPSLPI